MTSSVEKNARQVRAQTWLVTASVNLRVASSAGVWRRLLVGHRRSSLVRNVYSHARALTHFAFFSTAFEEKRVRSHFPHLAWSPADQQSYRKRSCKLAWHTWGHTYEKCAQYTKLFPSSIHTSIYLLPTIKPYSPLNLMLCFFLLNLIPSFFHLH